MITKEEFESLMCDYDINEVESRLNDISNGYLGCDPGATPEELQQNHHMTTHIVRVFRRLFDNTAN